ncbi:hypothetical protein [Oceanithermus desulfurans]|uniref:Outer membrane protein beta-barrel domain-containing protein n=2 Tax=Oceanithermus desulfurans TaxID=227924 RepID=A0A511RNI9_9DEIN|nr:hypothetical protein [Oceanithermus desulfurans]MBB6029101.1 hypothetical protein [Oceanithermus desulfurans]GEM90492.1 hypothetical protein ODE01S_19260 [Oceanithermus desulfurans NBRC 100063]
MRKWIVLLVLAMGSALAAGNFSVAGSAGYAGSVFGGVEASWDCILFQPKKGALRPTLDLGYGAGGFQAAFAMRHMFDVAEGVKVGGGVGVRYQGGVQAYLRGDVEYDLADLVNLPLFVGGDLGYAYGFAGAPSAVVAQFKAGYRF